MANAFFLRFGTLCVPYDAERRVCHSTQSVERVRNVSISFPCSTWECLSERSAFRATRSIASVMPRRAWHELCTSQGAVTQRKPTLGTRRNSGARWLARLVMRSASAGLS